MKLKRISVSSTYRWFGVLQGGGEGMHCVNITGLQFQSSVLVNCSGKAFQFTLTEATAGACVSHDTRGASRVDVVSVEHDEELQLGVGEDDLRSSAASQKDGTHTRRWPRSHDHNHSETRRHTQHQHAPPR